MTTSRARTSADAVTRLRVSAAGAVLRKVAGPDPTAARAAVHQAPGPRWFPPDSAIARVHGDASMFVGGIRALLLQSLHPRAMAAVAAHSGYRGDPWGRLQRTATYLAQTTFGPVEQAEQAVAVVRSVHRRVVGVSEEGEPYAASDPDLLAWVHLAEVDSFLLAHQRYGRRPLDDAGCGAYVAQTAQVGERLGAQDLPRTVVELHTALGAYRPQLRGTRPAREAAEFLHHETPLPAVARPFFEALWGAAVALLPVWARPELGLPVLRRPEGVAARAGGLAMTHAIRWALDAADPGGPPGEEHRGGPTA
ncbi:oxygenase MpaB family protein [Isoptericola sp. b490]|uniref:oxygenase MpaB family protein n=1 Tax=Actinotalea lenta TaxID=3064654 RepID=UPI0027133C6D|nr:oxygenase MpaB family protein [Isoptericola sp. b490]MDO8121185.1 oxygenase MpaB family protein [Isoptericola sp. b490]